MNYFIAYYLSSVIMSVYMSKKGLEFEGKIGGRKFKNKLSILLCSPLLFPFMCIVLYNEEKRKNVRGK